MNEVIINLDLMKFFSEYIHKKRSKLQCLHFPS